MVGKVVTDEYVEPVGVAVKVGIGQHNELPLPGRAGPLVRADQMRWSADSRAAATRSDGFSDVPARTSTSAAAAASPPMSCRRRIASLARFGVWLGTFPGSREALTPR